MIGGLQDKRGRWAAVLATFMVSVFANAQPIARTEYTLEARIAQAESVVVGRMTNCHETVVVPRGGRAKEGYTDPNGQSLMDVTVQVDEVLKGDLRGRVEGLRPVPIFGFDKRWGQWRAAGTKMLFFIGPAEKGGRQWTWMRLDRPVEDERGWYDPGSVPPVISMDFTTLKDGDAVLARARTYAKSSFGVHRVHRMGDPWSASVLPVDENLEVLAKKMIAAPETVFPEMRARSNPNFDAIRQRGADALRYFKSEANAELLRSLLNGRSGAPSMQATAFEVLLSWHVECPLPGAAPLITELDLSNTGIGDREIARLAAFPSLKTLQLSNTKVGADGLRALRGLKGLAEIGIDGDHTTDEAVSALGEVGMLHTLNWIFGPDQLRTSREDKIVEIFLAWTRVGDGAMKYIGKLANAHWMDLRDSNVSDRGLAYLKGMAKLKQLFLGGTKVSASGVARLRAALPNCKILWPLPTGH